MERFTAENKLPQDFDKMGEQQQNYELARLALEARRVLVLPQELPVPAEELEGAPVPNLVPKPVSTSSPAPVKTNWKTLQ